MDGKELEVFQADDGWYVKYGNLSAFGLSKYKAYKSFAKLMTGCLDVLYQNGQRDMREKASSVAEEFRLNPLISKEISKAIKNIPLEG